MRPVHLFVLQATACTPTTVAQNPCAGADIHEVANDAMLHTATGAQLFAGTALELVFAGDTFARATVLPSTLTAARRSQSYPPDCNREWSEHVLGSAGVSVDGAPPGEMQLQFANMHLRDGTDFWIVDGDANSTPNLAPLLPATPVVDTWLGEIIEAEGFVAPSMVSGALMSFSATNDPTGPFAVARLRVSFHASGSEHILDHDAVESLEPEVTVEFNGGP